MIRKPIVFTWLALSLSLVPAAALHAQTPVGEPQLDVTSSGDYPTLESVAVDGLGTVTLLWEEGRLLQRFGRRFSGDDVALAADFQVSRRHAPHNRAVANERATPS